MTPFSDYLQTHKADHECILCCSSSNAHFCSIPKLSTKLGTNRPKHLQTPHNLPPKANLTLRDTMSTLTLPRNIQIVMQSIIGDHILEIWLCSKASKSHHKSAEKVGFQEPKSNVLLHGCQSGHKYCLQLKRLCDCCTELPLMGQTVTGKIG